MIRCKENSGCIFNEQKKFQADRPLKPVNILGLSITKRKDAAARLAFKLGKNRFTRSSQFPIGKLVHDVAGDGYRLPEEDLSDIDRQPFILIDSRSQLGSGRRKAERAVVTVAVKLGMGYV